MSDPITIQQSQDLAENRAMTSQPKAEAPMEQEVDPDLVKLVQMEVLQKLSEMPNATPDQQAEIERLTAEVERLMTQKGAKQEEARKYKNALLGIVDRTGKHSISHRIASAALASAPTQATEGEK